MGYIFEWDRKKAELNLRKHGVQFDEASTVFGDPLALLMPDPDHSVGEMRYILLGMSINQRFLVDPDRDTMRKEYDFSGAVRGVTATRYAQGANVVVIDPEVLDVFPDALAVNEALCALAPVLRRQRDSRKQRKTRLATSSRGSR